MKRFLGLNLGSVFLLCDLEYKWMCSSEAEQIAVNYQVGISKFPASSKTTEVEMIIENVGLYEIG